MGFFIHVFQETHYFLLSFSFNIAGFNFNAFAQKVAHDPIVQPQCFFLMLFSSFASFGISLSNISITTAKTKFAGATAKRARTPPTTNSESAGTTAKRNTTNCETGLPPLSSPPPPPIPIPSPPYSLSMLLTSHPRQAKRHAQLLAGQTSHILCVHDTTKE